MAGGLKMGAKSLCVPHEDSCCVGKVKVWVGRWRWKGFQDPKRCRKQKLACYMCCCRCSFSIAVLTT